MSDIPKAPSYMDDYELEEDSEVIEHTRDTLRLIREDLFIVKGRNSEVVLEELVAVIRLMELTHNILRH